MLAFPKKYIFELTNKNTCFKFSQNRMNRLPRVRKNTKFGKKLLKSLEKQSKKLKMVKYITTTMYNPKYTKTPDTHCNYLETSRIDSINDGKELNKTDDYSLEINPTLNIRNERKETVECSFDCGVNQSLDIQNECSNVSIINQINDEKILYDTEGYYETNFENLDGNLMFSNSFDIDNPTLWKEIQHQIELSELFGSSPIRENEILSNYDFVEMPEECLPWYKNIHSISQLNEFIDAGGWYD